jgi:hypothetical protein
VNKPDMLTADELEELRRADEEHSERARRAFGGGPLTAAQIEARRQSDEWWERRLREMRTEEQRTKQKLHRGAERQEVNKR